MRVGFIGLGLMGSGMTNNLQKAGTSSCCTTCGARRRRS